MTFTFVSKLRGVGIALLVFLVASLGARSSWAEAPAPTESDDKKPATGAAAADATDKPATPPPVPQMQLEDEGPSTQVAKKVHHGMRTQAPVADDADEKPFWKSWIFWSVTGVLVAGAVGAVIYSTSVTRGSVGPCPANIALSLGCYGAGRM